MRFQGGALVGRVTVPQHGRKIVETPPEPESYAARLDIDYPDKLDRLTTFFRLIWAIPIVIILGLWSARPEGFEPPTF